MKHDLCEIIALRQRLVEKLKLAARWREVCSNSLYSGGVLGLSVI